MAKTQITAVLVGCEKEKDERNPEVGERYSIRADLGGGIVARLPLDTPGVEFLSVGIKATLEMELDTTSVIPWHIPSDTEGQPGRSGYALKNARLVRLEDGNGEVKEVKPAFGEAKDWSKVEATRTRSKFAPRTPTAPGGAGKAGGEGLEEEEDLDRVT